MLCQSISYKHPHRSKHWFDRISLRSSGNFSLIVTCPLPRKMISNFGCFLYGWHKLFARNTAVCPGLTQLEKLWFFSPFSAYSYVLFELKTNRRGDWSTFKQCISKKLSTSDNTWTLMGVYILKVAFHFLSGSTIEVLDCFFPVWLVRMRIL